MNTYISEDLPFSFAKQRKVLKSVITPLSPNFPAFSEGQRFIDLYLSPTLSHLLAYRYPLNEFIIVDSVGLCEALKRWNELKELRQELVDNSEEENDEVNGDVLYLLKSDFDDIVPENLLAFPQIKKIIKSWYVKTEDPEKYQIKPIPEDFMNKTFNYNNYFPQNVKVVRNILEIPGGIQPRDVIIVDEPKINVKQVWENYKSHTIFTFATVSSNSTTLIDIFSILGQGYTELFSKSRGLKTGMKIDKFVVRNSI